METTGDAKTSSSSSSSGKIQHRPGVRACKGTYLAITSFDIPYLLKYKTRPTSACFPQSSIGRTLSTHNEFDFEHNCMVR